MCEAIDTELTVKPKDFDELIKLLKESGYEFKDGKQPALKGKGQKRFVRFRPLGQGYSVEELKAVLSGEKEHQPKSKKEFGANRRNEKITKKPEMSFLIDIQAKMEAGKGGGYARWQRYLI